MVESFKELPSLGQTKKLIIPDSVIERIKASRFETTIKGVPVYTPREGDAQPAIVNIADPEERERMERDLRLAAARLWLDDPMP